MLPGEDSEWCLLSEVVWCAVVPRLSHSRSHEPWQTGLVWMALMPIMTEFVFGSHKSGEVVEQMAAEVANAVLVEDTALGHHAKQVLRRGGEARGIVNAGLEKVADNVLGQAAGVVGEETREQTPVCQLRSARQ